ncbi:unnamed protein product, partial [Cylicostephanus goldi]
MASIHLYPDRPRIYRCSIKGKDVEISPDQCKALELGLGYYPIAAIYGPSGTGKTLVGALIAAGSAERGDTVVVTADNNYAVAQITETILSIDGIQNLGIVRYVSDTAATENNASTQVDLDSVLENLGDIYFDQLSAWELEMCRKFKQERMILKEYLQDPDRGLFMAEQEKEDYMISEEY